MDARWKLLVGLVIIAGVAALTLRTSQAADPFVDVHDVAATPEDHIGRVAAVRGNVLENATVEAGVVTFRFGDLDPKRAGELIVTYNKTLPDGFGAKAAVVTGMIEEVDGRLVLRAETIQVGCTSKY